MRYVRDGAGSLDWGLPRTRHNGEVTRAGHPIPQGTIGVLEDEQYLRGAVGVSWLRVGQSRESLLVPPSPSRPLLKTLDTILATYYSQYMIDRGEIMDYIKQIRMQRYMKTPEYRLELYMAALYECGEALY